MKLTSKNKRSANGKVANEFTKEQALEALAKGLLAGGSGGTIPVVVGTTVEGFFFVPAPSDSGEGEGANIESWIIEEGGAISGGNCWAPASFL